MAARDPSFVYLEAYYPRTSPGFLIVSLMLFAALTGFFGFWVGPGFWPITLLFGVVTFYLAAVTVRQARGVTLATRVTDRSVYHAGWETGLFRKGLPGGEIPLGAIGSVETVSLHTSAGAGSAVALWLSDPQAYRLGIGHFARQIAGAGDLAIRCDETDRTAEQVRDAIDAALAANMKTNAYSERGADHNSRN